MNSLTDESFGLISTFCELTEMKNNYIFKIYLVFKLNNLLNFIKYKQKSI